MTTAGYTLETAQQALASQPFSQLIGARLTAYTESEVELTIDVTGRLHQQHGSVHGGVVAYAADNALAFVATTKLGKGMVTAGLNINFLRPARGSLLVARATVLHATGRQAVCRCEVYTMKSGRDRDHVATVTGTIVRSSHSTASAQV
ncbi:PaaI family thioesterase [Streptomyces avermitilis]|uniref:PaaI family thioesterase n=1 Tax=Streptomyces avermitilis TaxID=33903 RepID=UPI0036953A2D